ncbi:unnamed protein product [Caenorhabditis brenneri]
MSSRRQSKNNSHIWDNLTGVTTRRNPYYFNPHDTTGSTVSIVEYSREEITVVSPRPKCQHHHYHLKEKRAQKPKPKDVYVTNREREQAEQPKTLATWKYQPMRKEKYNPNAVSDAFEAYQHRLKVKKWAEPKITSIKKRVTINETATEVVENYCPHHHQKYQKLRVTNRRDDEIKIDNFTAKTVTAGVECVEEEEAEEEYNDEIRIQKKPGFYGTIEAEQCAEQAAGYLSYASENLDRLRFVTEAVYPQSNVHLKVLHDIEEDVKEFNSQMRHRRVRVPASAGTQTQVAHFIIHDN